MEVVDKFDIDVDIDDRQHLYDYVTRTLLRRPSSGRWDAGVLRDLGRRDSIPQDDENEAVRVSLMDQAIADKKCLLKKAKEASKGRDTWKEKETTAETEDLVDDLIDLRDDVGCSVLPRRVLPVFTPGEEVNGRVTLRLNKPLHAEAFSLSLMGYAHVNIRVYNHLGYTDAHAEEVYVDSNIEFWRRAETKGSSDTHALLRAEGGYTESKCLASGDTVYPFSFAIPGDARQSTPSLIPSTAFKGYVVYRLMATIDRGKLFSSSNITAHRGIWVATPFDIGRDAMHLEPLSSAETLDTGLVWKPGRITAKASVPRAGVLIGESVCVTLEIDNQSKTAIAKVEARVRMTGKARLGDKRLALSHPISVKSTKQEGDPIPAGMCSTYQLTLPWDFSHSSVDGNLLPVGTMDGCKLLDVKYDVRVKLTRKGAHRNLELSLPITVGNFNSRLDSSDGNGDDVIKRVFPRVKCASASQ